MSGKIPRREFLFIFSRPMVSFSVRRWWPCQEHNQSPPLYYEPVPWLWSMFRPIQLYWNIFPLTCRGNNQGLLLRREGENIHSTCCRLEKFSCKQIPFKRNLSICLVLAGELTKNFTFKPISLRFQTNISIILSSAWIYILTYSKEGE